VKRGDQHTAQGPWEATFLTVMTLRRKREVSANSETGDGSTPLWAQWPALLTNSETGKNREQHY